MKKTVQKNQKIKWIAVLLFTGILSFLFIALQFPEALREDYRQIASQEYDSVFLSMYPIDTYPEENFLVNGGITIFKASYCIPELSIFHRYMKHILNSGNAIHTMYLGIRPDKVEPKKLRALVDTYPSIHFNIMLSYPSAEYWKDLSVKEYNKVISAYCDFLTTAPSISNATFYFVGSLEWLIANPSNYEDNWLVKESIARHLLLLTFIDGEFSVTPETASLFSQALMELTEYIRSTPESYPDLSDYRLVFFGDSVIGNYTDTLSVPGVVTGLTDAAVFNCGIGGSCAAITDASSLTALPIVAEAFARGDLSMLSEDTQAYRGVSSYLSSPPSNQKICFLLYYGLNDYFIGNPISSADDPYDVTTYCGAIRTAITILRSGFPEAQIILCAPNCVMIFEEGTEPHGTGYVLEDYVNAVISLADELQTDIIDTYHDFEVNHDNWYEYLLRDQVHPSDALRYLIGKKITSLIHPD